MDYLARAMRVEEIPLLNKQYEEHLVLDKQFWEEQEDERVRIKLIIIKIETFSYRFFRDYHKPQSSKYHVT